MPIHIASADDSSLGLNFRREAEEHLRRGDRAAAARSLENAMRFEPTDDELPLLAATIHFQDGNLERAARLAVEAVRIRPFNPQAMNILGVACLDSGRAELGEQVLRMATRMAPGFKKARQNLRQARRVARRTPRTAPALENDGFPDEAARELSRPRDPRLSACVVARSDPQHLDECLASVAAVADEIHVVDATKEGAARRLDGHATIRVHRFAEDDDPAAARNDAVRHATGDWVLVLDSEEKLDEDTAESIQAAMKDTKALYHAVEVTFGADGPARRETRLFRNAPTVRYTRGIDPRIHPAIATLATKWGLRPGECGARICRNGNGSGEEDRRAIREGLGRAMRVAAEDEWETLVLRLDAARLDLEAGKAAEALDTLREIRRYLSESEAGGPCLEEETVTLEGRCLMRLERFAELAEAIREYHSAFEPTRNTLFLAGVAARATGDPAHAARSLRRCAEMKDSASCVLPLSEVCGAALPNMLGTALLDLGESEEASEAFRQGLALDAENLESELGLLGTRLALGEIQEVLGELERLSREKGDRPTVWSFGSVVLSGIPQLAPTARAWMEEACRRFPSSEEMRRRLGDARLRSGAPDDALAAWDGLAAREPSELAGLVTARLASGRELPSVPTHRSEAVGDGVLRWLQTLLACSAYEALDRALLEIDRAEKALPGIAGKTAGWLDQIGQGEAAARVRERLSA